MQGGDEIGETGENARAACRTANKKNDVSPGSCHHHPQRCTRVVLTDQ